MATPLRLHTGRRDDGTVLLSAAGELDLSNIDAFTEAVASALQSEPRDAVQLTIDLSGVEYLDSGAINAIYDHLGHIRRIIANPLLMSVLTVSGLTGLTMIETSSNGH